MVNEEILGGLRLAVSKGESLRQAMMSFYNSGYKKQEIEEAARALQTEKVSQPAQPVKEAKPKKPRKVKQKKVKQKVSDYETTKKTKIPPKLKRNIISAASKLEKPKEQIKPVKEVKPTKKKVSGYGEKPKSKKKIIIFVLIFFLLLLIGSLVAVFLFKQELIDIINSLKAGNPLFSGGSEILLNDLGQEA
jgi:uncharacterized membrane protein